MPPQSRGTPPKALPTPSGFQSKSTPNLSTLHFLDGVPGPSTGRAILHAGGSGSPEIVTSPSEPASLEDFSADSSRGAPSLSAGSLDSEDEGSDDGSEEEDGQLPNLPPRPMYHHYSRSHTYLAPSAFAPPFYGRPPTPLPPSPSLTSLLRPNFSSANSRPTTPDPSSDEGPSHTRDNVTGTQTPNSTLTTTFRSAKPIPRASPKVPTYEYYGFTLYLTSSLAFIVYCLWAFLPSPFLHQLGIYYFPDRWWALAIPAWTVMLVVYMYVALAAYNTGYLTLPMNSVECIVDEAANIAIVDSLGRIMRNDRPSWLPAEHVYGHGHGYGHGERKDGKGKNGGHSRQTSLTKVQASSELDWRMLWNEGTDAVMDVPIGGVCEILYGGDVSEDNEPLLRA